MHGPRGAAGCGALCWYRRSVAERFPIEIKWLGRIPYRDAWDIQHELVAKRRSDEIPDQLLLLEHPAVLTLGRHADPTHVLATDDELARKDIEVIRVERGGEVTYHGPGQLVAYPIVKLAQRGILLRPFVRALEQAMIDTAAGFGVDADRRDRLPGVWCDAQSDRPRKLGALGLRVEGGVTYHGIALNITTNLDDFLLIDPCGMPDAPATSIAVEAGWPRDEAQPSAASVARAADRFAIDFSDCLEEASAREPLAVGAPA